MVGRKGREEGQRWSFHGRFIATKNSRSAGPVARASWRRYHKLGPLEFDPEQYLTAIAKAESELPG